MRLFAVACLSALAIASLPAAGGELDGFVPPEDGARSCWSRSYSPEHLSAHPDQQVTDMQFALGYMEATVEFSEQYSFQLDATLRDGTKGYARGPCSAQDGKMWCGVECDGGGVLVQRRADGNILIDLESHGYIRMSESCGADNEDGFALESGKDDKQFLLQPEPPDTCKAAVLN